MPEAMAIIPSRRALPPLAQAFSMRVADLGVSPSQSAMIGAVWACPSNRSLEKLPRYMVSTSAASKPFSIEAAMSS